MASVKTKRRGTPEDPLDDVVTLPNAVSVVRLCLVPVFFVLLLGGQDLFAAIVFAVAACTDFVDGMIARSTRSVSKVGRVLDPAIDRLLMIVGVLGVYLVGRLPLWIILVVLARDLFMIAGYALLLRKWNVRVDVIFAGKVCTTLFFVGFAMLVLNWPVVGGLGLVDLAWLPGFGADAACLGIWPIYAGLLLCVYTTTYYVTHAYAQWKAARAAAGQGSL